jgi:CheY-like chemotaxis protein
MSSVLAIESHAERAELLRELVGDRVREPLTVVDSVEAALASIGQRVPEVILISPLMRPQDEAELVARLRSLPKASAVQTLITPQLSRTAATPSRGWKRRESRSDDEQAAFALELRTYVNMIRDQRVDLAAAGELSPADRRAAVRVASVREATLAVDGVAVDVVDLSVTGAQVLASSSLLVPGRTVKVVFENRRGSMQCRAAIVWGALEFGCAANGLQYRAGLDFYDGDRQFLDSLCGVNVAAPLPLDVPESFGRVLFANL